MWLYVPFAIIIIYFIGTLFGYCIHKLLHQPLMGRFYKAHMNHHLIQYPPESLLSNTYRNAGKDSTIFYFAPFVIVFVGIVIYLMYKIGVPLWLPILFICEVGIISFLHDYIHDATHVVGHWLEKFEWFQILRTKHIIHHHFMEQNFGIISFLWDKIFNTFKWDSQHISSD